MNVIQFPMKVMTVVENMIRWLLTAIIALTVSIMIQLLVFLIFRFASVMFSEEIALNGFLENNFEEY